MDKIIVLNGCIRKEMSRTLLLAKEILSHFKNVNMEWIDLQKLNFQPVNYESYILRSVGKCDSKVVKYAKKVQNADLIVLVAPIWEMSVPAMVKTFFENISIPEITFKPVKDTCIGNCKARKMIFITTRGMNVKPYSELDGAAAELKALCSLWGIHDFEELALNNCDYITLKEYQSNKEKLLNHLNKTNWYQKQ